jgi:ketosteroid isomerase-like protein
MSEESTTPDPVEPARPRFETINRRDLAATVQYFAPDAVMDLTRTLGVALRGREAIRRFLEDWLVGYEAVEYTADEIFDFGNGVEFAVVLQTARPLGTTGSVQLREGVVAVYAQGLIVRHTVYPHSDIDEARAAAERLAKERADA